MNRGFFALLQREVARFIKYPNTTLIPGLVSSLLYLIIFGVALGGRIAEESPQEYLLFLVPGLVLMNLVMGSYANPSGSLFMSRMLKYINDVLISPLSYKEMVGAYIIAGAARGMALGAGTWIISLIFVRVGVQHPAVFVTYVVLTSITFAALGIIAGLWAKRHDQLNVVMNFAITPLVFLGGVFYSVQAIPSALQVFTQLNPLFYMVNGVRYGMTGVSEASILGGILLLSVLAIILITVCNALFRAGWNLRS